MSWETIEAVLRLLAAMPDRKNVLQLSAAEAERVPAEVRGYWSGRYSTEASDRTWYVGREKRAWVLVARSQHSHGIVLSPVGSAKSEEDLRRSCEFATAVLHRWSCG